MKKNSYLIAALLLFVTSSSHAAEPDSTAALLATVDSIEHSLKYQRGTIQLDGGIGKVVIPAGFKYLDSKQAEYVLTELWGNPEQTSLGLIVPESQGVLSDNTWAFNIQYDEIGYVKDDDADDIDYDDLLEEMQNETEVGNKERIAQQYQPLKLIGWASKPFYDEDRKVLHWAKEIKFGDDSLNTLNYNVRILGRKGVLVFNAIASMNQLPLVDKNIDKVLNIVHFSDGYKYSDFDPKIDQVAAYTVGGLVAGKVLAKVGIFAFFGKFLKIIVIGLIGVASAVWKWLTGRRRKEETALITATDENLTDPQN